VRARDPAGRVRAVRASRSVADVERALEDPSPEVVRAAVARLVEIEGFRAAQTLRARLLTSDLTVVPDVAVALQRLGDAEAVEVAICALGDVLSSQRLAAALALGVMGDLRAREPLRAALDDQLAGVRVTALGALAKLDADVATVTACLRALSDADAQVRIAAVRAVERVAPGSLGEAAPLARDPDCLVRVEVARHIASLSDDAATRLLSDADAMVREVAARAGGTRQASTLAGLLVTDPSSGVRRAAARALGAVRDESCADRLMPGLEDPDALVRATVAQALERSLTRRGAVRRLGEELASPRPPRRRAAVYALARLRSSDASSEVWRLADDREPEVRLALIEVAQVVVVEPEPLLRYMATDPDAGVRHSARMRLERCGAQV
jgi:HEAT repeat protein